MDPKLTSLDDLYADKPNSTTKPADARPEPAEDLSPDEVADIAAAGQVFEEQAKATAEEKAAKAASPKAEDKAPALPGDDDEIEPSDVSGLKAALKATRQKARQWKEKGTRAEELEKQLNSHLERYGQLDLAARQMYAALQQQQDAERQPPQAPPDPMVDPEGALAYRDRLWAERLQEVERRTEHNSYMARLVPSQRLMRKEHPDYEEMEILFKEAADADPRLWQAIRAQEFPAEYAYNVAKEIKLRREIAAAGSLDKYVEQLAATKLSAQQPTVPTQNPAASAPKAPPPQSLARVPSVTPRNASKTYSGPTPLTDLYK